MTPDSICDTCKTSNISRTLVGNKIVDNSDVVGASHVGAAPTTFWLIFQMMKRDCDSFETGEPKRIKTEHTSR